MATRASDSLTQLEDTLDLLLKISAASYSFIARKSAHQQLNAAVPVWVSGQQGKPLPEAFANAGLLDEAEMEGSIDELVSDFVGKAKEAEWLLNGLPDSIVNEEGEGIDAVEANELEQLDAEMRLENKRYGDALAEAKKLQVEVSEVIRELANGQAAIRGRVSKRTQSQGN